MDYTQDTDSLIKTNRTPGETYNQILPPMWEDGEWNVFRHNLNSRY